MLQNDVSQQNKTSAYTRGESIYQCGHTGIRAIIWSVGQYTIHCFDDTPI